MQNLSQNYIETKWMLKLSHLRNKKYIICETKSFDILLTN